MAHIAGQRHHRLDHVGPVFAGGEEEESHFVQQKSKPYKVMRRKIKTRLAFANSRRRLYGLSFTKTVIL